MPIMQTKTTLNDNKTNRSVLGLFCFLFFLIMTVVSISAQEIQGLRCIKTEKKDSMLSIPEELKKQWLEVAAKRKSKNVILSAKSEDVSSNMSRWIAVQQNLNLCAVKSQTWLQKYIGETEKNLSVLFSKAAEQNSVLFFDEADALFGKSDNKNETDDAFLNDLINKVRNYRNTVIFSCKNKLCVERLKKSGFELIRQD